MTNRTNPDPGIVNPARDVKARHRRPRWFGALHCLPRTSELAELWCLLDVPPDLGAVVQAAPPDYVLPPVPRFAEIEAVRLRIDQVRAFVDAPRYRRSPYRGPLWNELQSLIVQERQLYHRYVYGS